MVSLNAALHIVVCGADESFALGGHVSPILRSEAASTSGQLAARARAKASRLIQPKFKPADRQV